MSSDAAAAWRVRSAMSGLVWPALPTWHAAQKLALLVQFDQQEWRSPPEIAREQFRQLERLVSHAAMTVPYYRERLTPFAERPLDAAAWSDIPILTRAALQSAGAIMQSEKPPVEHGPPFDISTSGSTGRVVKVRGNALTTLVYQACCLRDHLWHRRGFAEKLLAIRYSSDTDHDPVGQRVATWGPTTDDVVATGESVRLSILIDIPTLARRLIEENPGYLIAHASVIEGLARHCIAHGLAVPALREVRSLGESIGDDLRGLCRQAWNVPLVDVYSCQEAGYLAIQCPEHEHLHVQSENVYLEVVDAAGQPCAPGQIGRVLITSLNNFATPLIRYEIGDYAEVGAPCPCGRGLPVLNRVMGRYRNLLTYPDGTTRWPLMGNRGRLREVAPIDALQLVQTASDALEARVVMPRPISDTEVARLTTLIQDNQGYPFRITVRQVDSIRNPANGKIEQFISLLPAASAPVSGTTR